MHLLCRLSRCTYIITGEDGPIPRCKPFKYTYEKEIVIYPYSWRLCCGWVFLFYVIQIIISFCELQNLNWIYTYAYFKRLDYFSTECKCSFFFTVLALMLLLGFILLLFLSGWELCSCSSFSGGFGMMHWKAGWQPWQRIWNLQLEKLDISFSLTCM